MEVPNYGPGAGLLGAAVASLNPLSSSLSHQIYLDAVTASTKAYYEATTRYMAQEEDKVQYVETLKEENESLKAKVELLEMQFKFILNKYTYILNKITEVEKFMESRK